MTTARSPLRFLKQQADGIAKVLKQAERGEKINGDIAGKIAMSLKTGTITFGVVMDDKTLKFEMPWTAIVASTETALAEYILKHMKDSRDTAH